MRNPAEERVTKPSHLLDRRERHPVQFSTETAGTFGFRRFPFVGAFFRPGSPRLPPAWLDPPDRRFDKSEVIRPNLGG